MSVSVDDEPGEERERARDVLASWLDDYSEGRCDLEDVRESFIEVCRNDSEAPWDALALIDQYQRRGRIDAQLAQTLKSDVEQIAFKVKPETRGSKTALRDKPATASRPTPPIDTPRSPARPSAVPPRRDEPREVASERPPLRAEQSAPPPTEARHRRLIAERDAESTRPGTAFIDRTRLRPAPVEPDKPAAGAAGRSSEVGAEVLRERYELLSVLDRDEVGALYCAIDRHRSHLSAAARYVAVKVLNADYRRDATALVELERQFHQAQRLSHPNIANVFDLDRDGDRYFVVMEFIEGALLSDLLEQLAGEPMRRKHALAIIGGVGAALEYAHRREIVHGDLKPANVIITQEGEVRVLDFGFARTRRYELHSASGDSAPASHAYASVERINGSEPEPSDDVYSFACIAYELLSGRRPYEGRSALLARAHERPPQRIRGLERKQQQALQRALLGSRGGRRITVAELLAALGCSDPALRPATPDEILEPHPRAARWLRPFVWAASVALVSAAVIYVAPRVAMDALDRPQAVAPPTNAEQQSVSEPTAPTDTASAPQSEPTPALTAPERSTPQQSTSEQKTPERSTPEQSAAESRAVRSEAETPAQQQRERVASAPPAERKAPSAPAPAGRPAVAFEKDSYVVREGDGVVRLRVERSGSTRSAAPFGWVLRANSAQAGGDFAAIGPGAERIPAGEREASFAVPLVQDAVVENTEVFLVELQSESDDVALGERAHATVIIVDDD